MTSRINYAEVFPEGQKAMWELAKVVHNSGLEPSLQHLVFTRASQINGCAFCINMHTQDALKAGERDVRLYLLDAWRETSLYTYTERERAALALTEAMTLIASNHVPQDIYDAAAEEFDDHELAALMLSIVEINIFNRLSITVERAPAID